MVNNEYANAYTELMEILKYIPKEDFEKISVEKIEFYEQNKNKEYKYEIDKTLKFEEQIISDITKAILANIFRDYWATEEQKTRIIAKEKQDLENIEKEKREKYSPDDIFKEKKKNSTNETPQLDLIEYKKENWYIKFINYMKKIFNVNK